MVLKTLRFIGILCAALAMGLTITHDLEISGMQTLDGAEWLKVQHTFYGGFAVLGGIAEVVGLISTALLAFTLRKQRTDLTLNVVAALCFAGMLISFALGNNPLNQQIAQWTADTLPANWSAARDAWDGFHAISSGLATVAFVALLISTLRDSSTPYANRRAIAGIYQSL